MIESPKENALNKLKNAINDYKVSHPTIVEPEYINQFLNAFKNYLESLDQLNLEVAIEIIKIGKANAKATLDSIENQDVASILFYSHFLLPTVIDTKSEIGKKISVFVSPREPERFSNNPYQDSNLTKRRRKTWLKNVQLYSHIIAKKYIKRSERIFTKDEVMNRYHLDREKEIGVNASHKNLIEWIESYDKKLHEVVTEINIQIHDSETFNKAYTRWLKKFGT